MDTYIFNSFKTNLAERLDHLENYHFLRNCLDKLENLDICSIGEMNNQIYQDITDKFDDVLVLDEIEDLEDYLKEFIHDKTDQLRENFYDCETIGDFSLEIGLCGPLGVIGFRGQCNPEDFPYGEDDIWRFYITWKNPKTDKIISYCFFDMPCQWCETVSTNKICAYKTLALEALDDAQNKLAICSTCSENFALIKRVYCQNCFIEQADEAIADFNKSIGKSTKKKSLSAYIYFCKDPDMKAQAKESLAKDQALLPRLAEMWKEIKNSTNKKDIQLKKKFMDMVEEPEESDK
jgi:hypothetical protein